MQKLFIQKPIFVDILRLYTLKEKVDLKVSETKGANIETLTGKKWD